YLYASVDATWEPTDTRVLTVTTLSLNDGVQTLDFSDADPAVQIAATATVTYFVVAERTGGLSPQAPRTLRVTFDPDADSLVEDRAEDASVSVQDTVPVSTGEIILRWDLFLPTVLKSFE
ncbi:MAG: hypothetical protein PVH17_02755, partial [Anaerolineae bacterium]